MESSHSSRLASIKWVGVAVAFVGAPLLIFWSDLLIVINEGLVSEGYSHVLLLPFIFGYLVYRRRQVLSAIQNIPDRRKLGDVWTVIGLSLMLATFVVYFYSSETSYSLEWRLAMLPVFVSGMVLSTFGFKFWREIAIPIAFLLFFDQYFIELTNPYWALLANISAISSHDILGFFGYATQLSAGLTGPVITTVGSTGATYSFDIGLGSSGLQSLVGYTLFAAFVAYLFSGSLWKRVGLCLLGYPLLIVLNILRILGVIGLTNFVGQTAGDIFHLTGGLFLIFIGTILLLFIGQRMLGLSFFPILRPVGPCDHKTRGERYCLNCGLALGIKGPVISRRKAAGLALVAVSLLLLLSIQTPAYAETSSLNKVPLNSADPAVLEKLLPTIPGWNLTFNYRDTAIQSALQQDASLAFSYVRNNQTGGPQRIYAFLEIGPLYHTWEASLVTHLENLGLPSAQTIADETVHIQGSVTVAANYFVFIRPPPASQHMEAVLQWITRTPFEIAGPGTFTQRFFMLSIYSNIPAMVNTGLITNSTDPQVVAKEVLSVFMPFGQSIVTWWAPANAVTLIHLNLPVSYALIGAVAVPDALVLAGHSIGNAGRKKEVRRIVRTIASKQDLVLLQSVRSAQSAGHGLLAEIRKSYEAQMGSPADLREFASRLETASQLGILESRILDVSGSPYVTWNLGGGVGGLAEGSDGGSAVVSDDVKKTSRQNQG